MSKCKEGKLTLEWYNKIVRKEGDQYIIGKEEIVDLTMEEICELLSFNIENYPFIGIAQILSKKKGVLLQPFIKHNFDFDKYEYSISCYARPGSS